MDQEFSVANLRKILNSDREKGGGLEEKYISDAYKIRPRLRKFVDMLFKSNRQYRMKKISTETFERRKLRLNLLLSNYKTRHEAIVTEALTNVSDSIGRTAFRVTLAKLPTLVAGKTVYGIGGKLDEILAVRHVQRILKSIYQVKMPSRDVLIGQIAALVFDGVPKFILRSDVESFYESVRHEQLLESIHRSSQLSIDVKRMITRLLKDYARISSSNRGIPRGIGISAYLAEIYLLDIDRKIRENTDIFHYARYVDDIVLMYAPSRPDKIPTYRQELELIMKERGLTLNPLPHKTKELDATFQQKGKFEYLGYEFDLASGGSGITLSSKKLDKYKDRIKKSFTDYHKKKSFIPRKAADELVARSLFLTGNMRLFSRKSNAFIGIYFSNKFLTNDKDLKSLDYYYQHQLNSITNLRLKKKLTKYSFQNGFHKKAFRTFDPKRLAEISDGWHHA